MSLTTQFDLALEQFDMEKWGDFERLCSIFLASEYDDLRTMANPSGDGGRDSELFSDGKKVAFQYSVSKNFESKINNTVDKLKKNFPSYFILVYLTNFNIGSKGDKLKAKILKEHSIVLDIRDKNWFIERLHGSAGNIAIVEEIIEKYVKPLVKNYTQPGQRQYALTFLEAQAATVYLGLQLEDVTTKRNLTKLSFEALIRAALRDTDSEHRIKKEDIYNFIFSNTNINRTPDILSVIDGGLVRLARTTIKHWNLDDTYCLSYEEKIRVSEKIVEKIKIDSYIFEKIIYVCNTRGVTDEDDIEYIHNAVENALNKFLYEKGEAFVLAINGKYIDVLADRELLTNIIKDLVCKKPYKLKGTYDVIDEILFVSSYLLLLKEEQIYSYFRTLSNSYTLYSFLNQTPRIKDATSKIFKRGKIWLDTTVVLPLLGEQFDDERPKKIDNIIASCKENSIQIYITHGILEECLAHINKGIACSRMATSQWVGKIPYLYLKYIEAGKAPANFCYTLRDMIGDVRPLDDLEEYLQEKFNIEINDVDKTECKLTDSIKFAIERIWHEAHYQRRNNAGANTINEETLNKLVRHDQELYSGILSQRIEEKSSPLGYEHWLLTLDKIARDIPKKINEEFPHEKIFSPLMSFSFLENCMIFNQTMEKKIASLPLVLDIEINSENDGRGLLEVSDEIRRNKISQSERVVNREVRDGLDRLKITQGVPLEFSDEEN